MAKRLFILFCIGIIFFASLAFAALFALRNYSPDLISYFLQKQGCSIAKLKIDSIKKDQAAFSLIEGICKQKNFTIEFLLKNLRIQYEWRNLLDGKLAEIHLGSAQVSLEETSQVVTAPKKDPSTLNIPMLPFPKITIDEFIFTKQKTTWKMAVELENTIFSSQVKIRNFSIPKQFLEIPRMNEQKFLTENTIKNCNIILASNAEIIATATKNISGLLESATFQINPLPQIQCTQTEPANKIDFQFKKLALHIEKKKLYFHTELKPILFAKKFLTLQKPVLQITAGELAIAGEGSFLLENFTLEKTNFSIVPKNLKIEFSENFVLEKLFATMKLIFSPKEKSLQISDISLHTLDGDITITPILWNFVAEKPLPFDISVSKVSLQKLLQLKQDQEFFATGALSGKIPCTYQNGEFSMKGGIVKSEEGGILRYNPPSAASSFSKTNQGLSLALDALRNFQYSVLSTTLEFQPQGILQMAITLQGKNPDFQKGKAIHFNINLEENILALLKSMSIAEKFGNTIDQRIQSQQKNKTPPHKKATQK